MILKTEGLTKEFNGTPVVNSLDLSINAGDVFGFLGPNGAGKTTAIKMMVSLLEPTRGRCLIKDLEVTKNPIEVKKIIGYVPDKLGFYPNQTGRQALEYYSEFYGLKKSDINKRVQDLLDIVGLCNVKSSIGHYSRGMIQRLGIAQALINDPEILFLDEPTTGLDPEGLILLRNLIKELSAQNKTVFFSTHIIEEVTLVCNKIGIISSGKLIDSGTPEDVRNRLMSVNNYKFAVKVKGEMPKLTISGLISENYQSNNAIICAETDISEAISDEITKKGLTILELKKIEMSLEELFLETIYRRK